MSNLSNNSISSVVSVLPRYTHGSPDTFVRYVVDRLRDLHSAIMDKSPIWLHVDDARFTVKALVNERDSERFSNKRMHGVRNLIVHAPIREDLNDQMAAAAERFVADSLGRISDGDLYIGGDDCDFWFRDKSVDVKWTPRNNGKLLVNCRCFKKGPKDLYVLVTGSETSSFCIRGWATRAEVENDRLRIDPRGQGEAGECFALHQSELHPIDTLISLSGRSKPGEWIGLPWRVALALSANGWWLKDHIALDPNSKSVVFLFGKTSALSWSINQNADPKNWIADVIQDAAPGVICDPFGCSEKIKTEAFKANRELVLLPVEEICDVSAVQG